MAMGSSSSVCSRHTIISVRRHHICTIGDTDAYSSDAAIAVHNGQCKTTRTVLYPPQSTIHDDSVMNPFRLLERREMQPMLERREMQPTDSPLQKLTRHELLYIATLIYRMALALFFGELCNRLWQWVAIVACVAVILSFLYIGIACALLAMLMFVVRKLAVLYIKAVVRQVETFCTVHNIVYPHHMPI